MTDKQKESPGGKAAYPPDGAAGSDTGSGVHGSADLVRPGERVDDLQRAGLRIIQDPELFCFGMDAVLLSTGITVDRAYFFTIRRLTLYIVFHPTSFQKLFLFHVSPTVYLLG